MLTNEDIGKRVRDAREALGMSQSELGRRLTRQRTHAAVSDIERGKTKLTVEELTDLARVLGKDLAYFYVEQPMAGLIYRRSERDMTPSQHQAADQAIESFKAFARQQARRPSQG